LGWFMTAGGDQEPARTLSNAAIDLTVRLGLLGLLAYWSFRVIAPFITIGLWSAILAVALYPLFAWLARRLAARSAAALITVLCLLLVVGPVMWLGFGMIHGASFLVTELNTGQPAIPMPPEAVKAWPVIGERLHRLWSLAATNIKDALSEAAPMLKPVAGTLLNIAQNAFLGLLQLLASIVIAGFLLPRGPQMVDTLSALLDRALSHRGKEMVQLAGATVRNVSRGVVGISLLQASLAGVGFLTAGIPAAGVLAFIALLLGVLQIGPAILLLATVAWAWKTMETAHAAIFTAYMIPVGLLDNVLKPFLMARGLTTPMPVIMVGVIGGTIAYGIVGLFLGPIVLSVAWAVLLAWVEDPIAGEDR
jgi:predicted PurR-regulated permease PerM